MSKSKLVTRHIFIDTSVLEEMHFNFASPLFESLKLLAEKKRVFIHTTDITVREVRARMRMAIGHARGRHKEFRKEGRILENLREEPYETLMMKIDASDAEGKLSAQLDNAVESLCTDSISFADVSISEVFDRYFREQPPFGRGKKKNEFPDAFVIAALASWADANDQEMYVVSLDNDMKDACVLQKRLHHLQRIADFLDLVLDSDDDTTEYVHALVDKNLEQLMARVQEEFHWLGFILARTDGADGDVEDVTAEDAEILDYSVVALGEDTATIEVQATVEYSAAVSYEDLDTAIWDSENKVLITFDTVDADVQENVVIHAHIDVSFSKTDPSLFEAGPIEFVEKDVIVEMSDD